MCKFQCLKSQKRRGHCTLKEFGVLCSNQPVFTQPNGTERGYVFLVVRSVPGKKPCLGPCRILVLASQTNTNGNLLRMSRRHDTTTTTPRHNNSSVFIRNHSSSVHLHLQCRPSPSNKTCLCPFGRAVRSSQRKGFQGLTLPLPTSKTVFLVIESIRFQYQPIWQIIFHSFRSSAVLKPRRPFFFLRFC